MAHEAAAAAAGAGASPDPGPLPLSDVDASDLRTLAAAARRALLHCGVPAEQAIRYTLSLPRMPGEERGLHYDALREMAGRGDAGGVRLWVASALGGGGCGGAPLA